MHKISVIVPIYNTEKYLEKCINSILNQEHKDIQLILVNDGSTDGSGKIAKEFAQKDNRVLYIEKENGGLSDARNCGLEHVEGDYILFVDSDDYIAKNLFKDLEYYMDQDYDMVKFKIYLVDEDGNTISENESVIFDNKTGEEAFNILYSKDKMLDVAWGYVYKAKFWKENEFCYAKGLYHEDFGLTSLIMLKAKKVASTHMKGYNYVQTKNSMVRDDNKKAFIRAKDMLKHYDNMIEKLKQYSITEESEENIKIYYKNSILMSINNLKKTEEREEYIKEIKKRKIIRNIKARNLKQLLKKIILNINIEWYLKLRKDK